MKLARAITGMGKPQKQFDGLLTDKKEIHACIGKIHYSTQFDFIKIDDPAVSKNYFTLYIKDINANQEFNILINATYPYYCGTSIDSSWMNLSFIELPLKIIELLGETFEYLNPIQLNTKLKEEDLIHLHKEEIEQIKYWQSKTFGEIIFNGYD